MKDLKNNKDNQDNNDIDYDFLTKDNVNEKDKRRIIIYIIIIVVLLLLLITSCTSGFLGKVGNLFRNEGNYDIDKDRHDLEEVLNQDLKFESDNFEVSETDTNIKLGFGFENINPTSFTCATSNASIATCYVSDGYVIVNPKSTGEVTVMLQTTTNGKIYKASTKVNVIAGTRKLELESTSGTIYLGTSKIKNVKYTLTELSGNISVTSSDESVATGVCENGILKITALKKGNATITLTLIFGSKTFEAKYELTVLEGKNPYAYVNPSKNKPSSSSSSSSSSKDKDKDKDKDDNKKPQVVSDSTLKSLTTNRGTLTKDGNNYSINVNGLTYTIDFIAIPNDSNATLTYRYKRADKENFESITSITGLKLRTGANILVIDVTSSDKTKTSSYNVTINKSYAEKNYLKDISLDGKTIQYFDKTKEFYEIDVASDASILAFSATPWSSKATLSYTYNGVDYKTLDKIHLLTGLNSLKIYVTDNDNKTRVYTLQINRKKSGSTVIDTNSYLKDLTITGENTGNLIHNFDPYKKEYFVGVDNNVTKFNLTAHPSSTSKTVKISYKDSNGREYEDIKNLDLTDIPLNVGKNEITITVTNNGNTEEYKIHINRANAAKTNTLTNLSIIGYELTPAFNENTLEYKVLVDKYTDSVYILGESSGTITYNGTTNNIVNLTDGLNKVVVSVDNERDYIINIYKESSLSSDTSINNIKAMVNGVEFDITDTYTLDVKNDVNEVSLIVSTNGKEITYNGSSSNVITLNPGENKVILEITAEDGTKNKYQVTINKEKYYDAENPTLDVININDTNYVFNSDNNVTVDIEKDEEVIFSPIDDENIKVDFIYNNNIYKDVTELNNSINSNIKNGNNKVSVIVMNKDGYHPKEYTVNLIKDLNYLIFDGSNYMPENERNINGEIIYDLTLPYKGDALDLKVKALDEENTNITYNLNGENIDLTDLASKIADYSNTLKMTVSNTESSRTYIINIKKPTRTIEIESIPDNCYLDESSNACSIVFVVKETLDGENYEIVTDDDRNVKIDKTDNEINLDIILNEETEKYEALLTPKKGLDDVTITLGIKGYNEDIVSRKINFIINDNYELSTKLKDYTMNLIKPEDSKEIIFYSQNKPIFKDEVIESYNSELKELTIYEKNNSDTKVVIKVTEDTNNAITSLKYSKDKEIKSLAVLISANKAGIVKINATGYVMGKKIEDEVDITLTITKKYTVNLHANGGVFGLVDKDNPDSSIRTFILSLGDKLNLSEYEPFKGADENNCNYFEFIGFSTKKDDLTTKVDNDFEVVGDIDLYALYETSEKPTPEDKEFNTLWIDPTLFQDAESKESIILSPGVSGSYIMNFKNTTGSKIEIIGLDLVENTPCVAEGCLPMGYIIKYTDDDNKNLDELYTYYLGTKLALGKTTYENPNYEVISRDKTDSTSSEVTKVDIHNKKPIFIDKDDVASISLFFKWVDDNNILDTAIGKNANNSTNNNITDKYGLRIGIRYKLVNDACSNTNIGS